MVCLFENVGSVGVYWRMLGLFVFVEECYVCWCVLENGGFVGEC